MNFLGPAMLAFITAVLAIALVGVLVWAVSERGRARRAEDEASRLGGELATATVSLSRLEERAEQLGRTSEAVADAFKVMSNEAVNQATEALLKRAEEAFVSRDRLVQERIEKTLQPVKETLGKFEEQVRALESKRDQETGSLKTQIEQLLIASTATQEEAKKLSSALRRGPGVQGRWGEQMLRNVLEMSGLRKGVDFEEQFHTDDGEGAGRPDVIVRLPGSAFFVIDSKVSLNDYQTSIDAQDELSREAALKAHCDSIRRHVTQLSSKAYWAKFDKPPKSRSPDVVVMFVPLESAFACAMERHPALVAEAWERKVAIVTPAAMFPLLRAVAYAWRAEDQAANARDIADAGKELHKRVAIIAKYASDLGMALNKAVGSYNDFTASLERNVLTQAKRFESLAAQSERTIVEMPALDVPARALTKLTELESVEPTS